MRANIASNLGNLLLANIEQADMIDQANAAIERSYQLLAECIRSEQVPDAAKVMEEDPRFAAWYRANYPEPEKATAKEGQ